MAVHLNQTAISGTLARVPFAGGVPRPAVEGVLYAGADWSPEGRELAIVRLVEGRSRLEFPVGKVLYEGSVGAPRFSPRGDLIAFQDMTGAIKVIGSAGGQVRTLSKGWLPFGGGAPCWTPDGKEIWFSAAAEPGVPEAIHAVDLEGKVRLVAQMPGFLELDDISEDGRVLLAHHTIVNSLWGLSPGESVERDLTWLDWSVPAELSTDGKTILFSESGEAGRKTGSVYLRKMDGSPAVRLGEGEGVALSPDGAWVLVSYPNDPQRLALLPTAIGEMKSLPVPGFERIASGAFLPDGSQVIFAGRERGKSWGLYALAVGGGKPRRVAPERVSFPPFLTRPVSPDGRWVLAESGSGTLSRYPLQGGEPRPVAGIEKGEWVIGWGAAGLVFVYRGTPGAVRVHLVDPDSGRRTLSREIHLADPAASVGRIAISADGRSYAYSTRRIHSQLYVVEGLK
jgi:Tol biopolymer transport system component